MVDNRGSNFRGLAFEAPLAGHLGGVEIADQCAASSSWPRPARSTIAVAITGGSYGGFMTPDVGHPAAGRLPLRVAIAPVTDQLGYDTAYIERYLGHPAAEPEAYARSSVLPHADRLNDSVLVIHGAIDENVHLRHSIRLAAAVQSTGRDLELILPDDRHRVRSPKGLLTRDRRTVSTSCTAWVSICPRRSEPPAPRRCRGTRQTESSHATSSGPRGLQRFHPHPDAGRNRPRRWANAVMDTPRMARPERMSRSPWASPSAARRDAR